MLQLEMARETAHLMGEAVESRLETSILINNRAGGNAPIIAQRVAELKGHWQEVVDKDSLQKALEKDQLCCGIPL